MGEPKIAAFSAGALGWDIADSTMLERWMPERISGVPRALNRLASTNLSEWTSTGGLMVTRDAIGPDSKAQSAFTLAREGAGARNITGRILGNFEAGVVTCTLWLKSATASSVRLGLLGSRGNWHASPDVVRSVSKQWRRYQVTGSGIGASDGLSLVVAVDANGAEPRALLAAHPSCNDGGVAESYLPVTRGRRTERPYQSLVLGENVIGYGDGPPTVGQHEVGDIWFNTSPVAGGRVGWVCVEAGVPGAWKAFGAIDQ